MKGRALSTMEYRSDVAPRIPVTRPFGVCSFGFVLSSYLSSGRMKRIKVILHFILIYTGGADLLIFLSRRFQ